MRTTLSLFVATLICAAAPATAQESDTLTAEDGWRSSLVTQLSGSQAAFSNWQEGGINALAVSISGDGQFDRVMGRMLVTQEARAAFGLLKQDTLDARKAEDVFRYLLTADMLTGGVIRPTASFGLRTQFAPGYDFSPDAADYPSLTVTPGERLKVSDFAAPAQFTQSAGMAYVPGGGFEARLGLGLKETVVGIERLRPVFGNGPDQMVRVQAGVEAGAKLTREIAPNVLLKSRLGAFQAFNQVGNVAPDIIWENTLAMKVNEFLNVNLDTATIYDQDISSDLQLKEVLSIGVSFVFI
ncbi:MAG: DUF3078 domain-containing protein [Rubricoccaceae bacterium]